MNENILIIQTAFLGDVILSLPLVQALKKKHPDSKIDFLCIPGTSGLLKNNPYIDEVIIYNKRNSGVPGLIDIIKKIRNKKYDLIISPHRSARTSMISYFSSAKKTITFDKSNLSFLYDVKIPYAENIHEIRRNLSLLEPLGNETEIIRPELFTGEEEKNKIDKLFSDNNIPAGQKIISIAPGSAWFTKKFPKEKFVRICDLVQTMNAKIFLIGGKEDRQTSEYIENNSASENIINVTGQLSILESAELIKRSSLLITNDSAPLHIGNAEGISVIAIFGATIPAFGFYPYGKNDIIFETNGLSCRPCSIHGGNKCPIGTFECMLRISEENIAKEIKRMLS